MSRIERDSSVAELVVDAIGGDLRVQGHPRPALMIEGDDPDIEESNGGATLHIRCGGDCIITLPEAVSLKVFEVGGDAKISNLNGAVAVDTVGSDLVIRHINGALNIGTVGSDLSIRHVTGATSIGSVGSDLEIKHIEGDVSVSNVGSDLGAKHVTGNIAVENVGSDVSAEAVEGDFGIERVGSDLSLRDVSGSCYCPAVDSDIILSLAFNPEKSYLFGAGSDIVCYVAPETSATFLLSKRTEVEVSKLDAQLQKGEDGKRVVLGEGGPEVRITEADSFTLAPQGRGHQVGFGVYVDFDRDMDEYVSNIEAQINQSLKGLSEKIEQQVSAATNFTNQFMGKRKRDLEGRAERMQQRAERMQQRVEERLERDMARRKRFEERMEREPGKRKRGAEWEPPSQEERLMILQMLEAGKLTVEQAEQLLRTIEGAD